MKTLLLYATNSGNTYYAAHRIADVLAQDEIDFEIHSIGDVTLDILDAFDAIILGSCTWNRHTEKAKYEEGQLQDQMQRFVDALSGKKFPRKKFAVFGLGDSDYMKFCAAADHLERFVSGVEGQKMGDTLRIDSFPQGKEEAIDAWTHQIAKLLKDN